MKLSTFLRFFFISFLLGTGLWVGNVSAELLNTSAYTSPIPSVYSAVLDFEAGWSTCTNPNGVWSYGWSSDLTAPITLFPECKISDADNGQQQIWHDPDYVENVPHVGRNSGGDFDDENVSWAAGFVGLHHGPEGEYAHVIFTAPSYGWYAVVATFYAQQYEINVDVHVLVNGKVHFSDTITNMPESTSFARTVLLRAGQKINFASGPNGLSYLHPGHTGLEAVVTKIFP